MKGLRKLIREVLVTDPSPQAHDPDERLPVSEFSREKPLYVWVIEPHESHYEKLRPYFAKDAFGHGFYLWQSDALMLDGGAGLDANQLKAVEAHEAAHAHLGHRDFRNPEFERAADELAIEMLDEKGFTGAADLLRDRLRNQHLGEARKIITEAVHVDVDFIHDVPDANDLHKMVVPQTTVPVDAEALPVIAPPGDLSAVGLLDLEKVIEQMQNPVTSPDLAEIYDNDIMSFFKVFVESRGRSYNESYYKNVVKDLKPLILKLKYLYNRPRPYELAALHGLTLRDSGSKTSDSPSYPSGHTIQAYVIAILLAYQFPDLTADLIAIAELIAQSRVDAGVHFQSDVIFGRMLAALIAKEILDENFA